MGMSIVMQQYNLLRSLASKQSFLFHFLAQSNCRAQQQSLHFTECRMADDKRQKQIRFYSDKHNRRLIQQQNEADVYRIFGALENLPPSFIPIQTINPSGNERLIHTSDQILEHNDIHEVLNNENDDSDCNSSIHSYEYPNFNSSDDNETEASDIESIEDEAENDDEIMINDNFIQDIATWMRQFKTSQKPRIHENFSILLHLQMLKKCVKDNTGIVV
ncbi:uncharacterized protein LOC112589301 [Harpegnathos saltator]|uniref:uncharacterized protein LOC112589301 n=1 Tax=Harpegnathos saltator TaxID=610380 RepID=UPI000DBEF012|nr:uncharacterized protein LOC112589301 [Harpegnathos saltator]